MERNRDRLRGQATIIPWQPPYDGHSGQTRKRCHSCPVRKLRSRDCCPQLDQVLCGLPWHTNLYHLRPWLAICRGSLGTLMSHDGHPTTTLDSRPVRPSGASPSPGLAKTSALVHTWIQKGSIPRLTSWRSVISLLTTLLCTYHLLSIHPLQSQSYTVLLAEPSDLVPWTT